MKVSEFEHRHPYYKFDFEAKLNMQSRIYDAHALDQFPVELEAEHPYRPGGRGRPNLNQTLAHSQCATCHRVLRNDMFYTLPSMQKRNVVFSHCRECNQHLNAQRYDSQAEVLKARRHVIWQTFAPRCAICGFDAHVSAMDIHHPDNKEGFIAELITSVALTLDYAKVEILFREIAKCSPLCSNCHRMAHASAIPYPKPTNQPSYRIADLLEKLKMAK